MIKLTYLGLPRERFMFLLPCAYEFAVLIKIFIIQITYVVK